VQAFQRTTESHGRTHLAILLALSVAAGACRELSPTLPAPSSQPRPALSIDALPSVIRPEEQLFADLAAVAPTSAGFYIDSAGVMVVYVTDPLDDGKALAGVRELLSDGKLPMRHVAGIRVRRAKYTFAQLARLRDMLLGGNLFGVEPAAISLDLDEMNNRVTIGLDTDAGGLARYRSILF
jgi:hypothetical protein